MPQSAVADVTIVGGGLSGICAAIRLRQAFSELNLAVYEKSDDIGGTWKKNTYPNLSCDIPSQLYQYSFALNPDWSTKFACQSEMVAYIKMVVSDHGLQDHIILRHECLSAEWLEEQRNWKVAFINHATGVVFWRHSRVLLTAVGFLDIPNGGEEIVNLQAFSGRLFHSSNWDHNADFTDQDILVVGNGCSANQIIPWLIDNTRFRSLTQVIRSAQWIGPKNDKQITSVKKWILRKMPIFRRISWWALVVKYDIAYFAIRNTFIGRFLRTKAETFIANHMKHTAPRDYHDILIPSYPLGAKRPVLDHGYLKGLNDPRVRLIKSNYLAVTSPRGLSDADGVAVSADIIILANGYKTQKLLTPMTIIGERESVLPEIWQREGKCASAYMGVMVPNFPNLFLLTGPNTLPTGHSTLFGIECSVEYIIRILKPLCLNPSTQPPPRVIIKRSKVAVTQEAHERFNQSLDRSFAGLVSCKEVRNWYKDDHSEKNTLLWPKSQLEFWWSRCVRRVRWQDFDVDCDKD